MAKKQRPSPTEPGAEMKLGSPVDHFDQVLRALEEGQDAGLALLRGEMSERLDRQDERLDVLQAPVSQLVRGQAELKQDLASLKQDVISLK